MCLKSRGQFISQFLLWASSFESNPPPMLSQSLKCHKIILCWSPLGKSVVERHCQPFLFQNNYFAAVAFYSPPNCERHFHGSVVNSSWHSIASKSLQIVETALYSLTWSKQGTVRRLLDGRFSGSKLLSKFWFNSPISSSQKMI